MKAIQIRGSVEGSTDFEHIILAEIAAQLAELNEKLQDLSEEVALFVRSRT